MKKFSRLFFSFIITALVIIGYFENCVYADLIDITTDIDVYEPSYYIGVACVLVLVVAISIFILTLIYKNNKIDEKKEDGKTKENKEENK